MFSIIQWLFASRLKKQIDGVRGREAIHELLRIGWSPSACWCFLKQLRIRSVSFNKAVSVGSSTYLRMLEASYLTPYKQLDLIINKHLRAEIDEHGFLQLTSNDFWLDPDLEPESPFFYYFRELVVRTYKRPEGLNMDELGRKIHLFRSYLDRQVINYVRQYGGPQRSDYGHLLKYCNDHQMELDYQTGANFHNRYHGHFDYPRNMKVQLVKDSAKTFYNNARMMEFIIDLDTHQFVSQWNVYRYYDGYVDSDPDHYDLEQLRQVADTESFNYGIPKGVYQVPTPYQGTHRRLDIHQPPNSYLRRCAKDYWKFPRDYQDGGNYADLVKDGEIDDVRAWNAVPEEQRREIYAAFVADLKAHHRKNHGIKHFLDQAKKDTLNQAEQ